MLTYENSNHVDETASSTAVEVPAAPAKAAESTQAPQLTYEKSDRPLPQGAAPENLPPAIKELRERDEARRLYSPQITYRDVIKVGDDWPEENKTAAAEWCAVFADNELSSQEASELVTIVQELEELPSAEMKAAWEGTAWSELCRQYGDAGAKEALADAQRFIARDPRVQHFLAESGLGSHPKIVARVVQAARNQRGRF